MSGKRRRSPSPPSSSSHPRPTFDGFILPLDPPPRPTGIAKGKGRAIPTSDLRPGIADLFPYQEIFLRILSFLAPSELANMQGVSRYWSRMSLDPQLWKRLYLARYPHPHHSRLIYKDQDDQGRRNHGRRRLRPISRLPSRAFPPPSPSRSESASSLGASSPAPSSREGSSFKLPKAIRAIEEPDLTLDDIEVGTGVRNDGVDWKMMLRLGTNWSNGNAVSELDIPLPPSPSPTISSLPSIADISSEGQPQPPKKSEQHIALSPSFIFTTHPDSPLVHVFRSSSPASAMPPPDNGTSPSLLGIIPPPPGWSSPHRPDNITAICADQSVSVDENETDLSVTTTRILPTRIAVFHRSGGFVVLRVRLIESRLNWHREAIQLPQSRPRSIRRRATTFTPLDGDPVILATLHYPLLVTCTLAFHLSTYTIPPPASSEGSTPPRPHHLNTMHSDISFHPASLSLHPGNATTDRSPPSPPTESQDHFRAALTYCTPLYPSSWTIAVQEFGIDLDPLIPSMKNSARGGDVWRGDCFNVGQDPSDLHFIEWPRIHKPIVGVKGGQPIGVGSDARWCILAGEDNQIQVYTLPTSTASGSKTPPIVYSQTLLAHSAAITSVSLQAGRCVSGGRDGRILVWELDEAEAEEGTDEGRRGRTIGFVEVKKGGRRQQWTGPSGPWSDDVAASNAPGGSVDKLAKVPHPASISSAARSLFLPRLPDMVAKRDLRPPPIRQLAFDEEKIVGLIRMEDVTGRRVKPGSAEEIMKVWTFS